MSRNPMQKQKLLYLRKILLEKTDENHGLTSSEILAELALYGITAERKSLYDDLQVLENSEWTSARANHQPLNIMLQAENLNFPN